jgi:hypothetical protein
MVLLVHWWRSLIVVPWCLFIGRRLGSLHQNAVAKSSCFDAAAVIGVEDRRAGSRDCFVAAGTGELVCVPILEVVLFGVVVVGDRHVESRSRLPERATLISIGSQ